MLERASGQFIIDGQVEDILGGISGAARIARISQSCQFTGQLEGESMAEFTAVLPREGDGCFHGFQRISGSLGEREGTFVLSVTGEILKGQPRGSWTIVPKSGSGDFAHIRGSGTFSLPDGKPGKYQFEFDLRKPRAAKTAAVELADETPNVAGDEAVAAPDEVFEAPVAAVKKPARKAAPVADVIAETPAKRTRSRKAQPAPPEQLVAVEQPAKRTRSRKTETATPVPVAVTVPPTKRTRSRKAEPIIPEPPVAESTPKPKRTRKSAPPEPAIEPVVAEVVPESAPTKPARRKKAVVPEPIALPVNEPAPARKRRAKAA